MDTDPHATDLLTLFLRSFRTLDDRLAAALPNFPNWIMLAVGILLIGVSVFAYLNSRRLSGRFHSLENTIGVLAGAGLERPGKPGGVNKRGGPAEVDHPQSIFWLMLAGVSGAVGLGATLGVMDSQYNLSLILLGYGLAAVAVLNALFLVTHRRLGIELDGEARGTEVSRGFLVRWVVISACGFTVAALLCAFESSRAIGETLCVVSAGSFLTMAVLGLAVAEVHNSALIEHDYLLRLKIQLDRRLQVLANRVFKQAHRDKRRLQEEKEKRRTARLRCKRLRREVEAAYEIGRLARSLAGGAPTGDLEANFRAAAGKRFGTQEGG